MNGNQSSENSCPRRYGQHVSYDMKGHFNEEYTSWGYEKHLQFALRLLVDEALSVFPLWECQG